MSAERETLLNTVDFEWDPLEAAWHKNYAALQQFAEREGHGRVAQDHVEALNGEDLKLGTWTTTQRQAHKKDSLDPGRKRLLDELVGWRW